MKAKKILNLFLTFTSALIFFSCADLNKPVKKYFEYYTDTAAIEVQKILDSYEVNGEGIKCFDSTSDKTIEFYLRNPQDYTISFNYEYDYTDIIDNTALDVSPLAPYDLFQDSEDKSKATIKFAKEFLKKIDNGDFIVTDAKSGETKIVKNISGYITLTERDSGRSFDPYRVEICADSKPPRYRFSMFQRKGKRDSDGTCFVLCMNIPKLNGTVHENDTHSIYVGNDHWTFSGNISSDSYLKADAGNIYTLTTSEPATLYSLDGGDKVFDNPDPSAYTSLYYIINDKSPNNFMGNLEYLLKLVDDAGLYSSTLVTNTAEQLRNPLVQNNEGVAITSSETYPADDTTGYFEVILTHSRGTFHFDEAGEEIDGAPLKTMPQIVYTITKNEAVYTEGTARAPVKINLPPDTNTYSIKAYAIENGYVDSLEIDPITNVKVTRSTNYYVNQNGQSKAEGANGSPMHPYKNMQQCITDINADTDNGDGPFTIYMQTDIEAQDSDFNSTECTSYITIPENKKITIQGLNGLKTLNLNRSETKNGYGIQLSNGELALKDIKITGGVYDNSDGSGGIDYESTGKLSISGTVIIEGNQYIDERGTLKSNNIFARGSINKIYITGPISGTRIGIYTSSITPTVAQSIQFTDGYNTYNSGVKPAKYFFSDGGFGITDKGGEAVLAVSGGTMGDVISSQSMTFTCAEYTNALTAQKFIKLYPGIAKEIEITPELKLYDTVVLATDDIWSSVSWSTWLTCDETEIPGTRKSDTGCTIKGVIPASVVYEDNYILHAKATLYGVSYDASWPVKGKKDISYMTGAPATPGTYSISSSDGLKKLKEWVEEGNVAGRTYVFELNNDIVAESSVVNIGTSTKPFMATFDGKGYTISGLNITSSNDGACGLFAYIDSSDVSNITIAGTFNNITGLAAGLVGKATNSKIVNCTNKATISNTVGTATKGLAGICNTANNTIIDGCVNEGNITNNGYLAGILTSSSSGSIVRNCINKGDIESTKSGSYAGGIEPSQSTNIYNCYNLGKITTTSGKAGGIVAQCSTSYIISNCFSYAVINGSSAGNIAGTGSTDSASKYNYFIIKTNSGASAGIGSTTTTPQSNKCEISSGIAKTTTSISIDSYSGYDVIKLLNAWITTQGADASIYKQWKYDGDGYPVFIE